MPGRVHVLTMVGGQGVGILPHTIEHYQSLGVASFHLIVHTRVPDDTFVSKVKATIAGYGVGIDSVVVHHDFHEVRRHTVKRIMGARPDDWFLPINCDELHQYPRGLMATLEDCESHGYDHLHGCLVDRISADGALPDVRRDRSIWQQYPLGGVLTRAVLRAMPLKIVAAKGHVELGVGHNRSVNSKGCSAGDHFIPIHHFKWVGTLIPFLQDRRRHYENWQGSEMGNRWWVEADRFLRYFDEHGRIDLSDPRLLIAPCDPEYPFWDRVRRSVFVRDPAVRKWWQEPPVGEDRDPAVPAHAHG